MKCNLLLEQGKLTETAALFDGVKNLADFSPNRTKIHVTELINIHDINYFRDVLVEKLVSKYFPNRFITHRCILAWVLR